MTTDRAEGMSAALDTAEGRRLLEKATSAPWAEVHGKHASFIRTPCYSSGEVARCDRWRDEAYGPTAERSKANAALIVYAVNNLPALLSAVAALERERDEAVKAERERCAVLRVWLLNLSANESDPNEPVADNGATVWDHIRGDARRFAESLT